MSKKNPYEDLDSEWKDAIASMEPSEIRQQIAKVMLDESQMQKAKKADKDLKEKKLAYDTAAEKYKDGSAMNSLKFKLLPKEKPSDATKYEIADLALAQVDLLKEKEDDQELTNAKEAYQFVNSTYTDGTKMNRLRIKYCRQILVDKHAL